MLAEFVQPNRGGKVLHYEGYLSPRLEKGKKGLRFGTASSTRVRSSLFSSSLEIGCCLLMAETYRKTRRYLLLLLYGYHILMTQCTYILRTLNQTPRHGRCTGSQPLPSPQIKIICPAFPNFTFLPRTPSTIGSKGTRLGWLTISFLIIGGKGLTSLAVSATNFAKKKFITNILSLWQACTTVYYISRHFEGILREP